VCSFGFGEEPKENLEEDLSVSLAGIEPDRNFEDPLLPGYSEKS
jgi:hypothetical protein